MWGGTPVRNMVSDMRGLPVTWDIQTKKNVRWMATLGSQSYGNPVVAGGKVFVGTNNEGLRDPKQPGDRGVLMAFSEKDGAFLWQITHEKLAAGRVNDWPYQGIASSPLVEGDRLYYVSNRCELMCVDTEGFRDGENDGPYKDEKLTGEHDGDIVWKLDMMDELGVLAAQHVELLAGLVGRPALRQHHQRPGREPREHPLAARARDHRGRQEDRQGGVGGQLAGRPHPARPVGGDRRSAEIGGVVQVIHPQGDGWVRGYDAKTGQKLWEFDANPKDSVWPKTRNEVIATPVVYDGLVYIGNGQDPEHGEGVGHFYAIDPSKRGDITQSGTRLALRQDPPLDLDRRDQGRHRLHRRLQRLPARARRQDRQPSTGPTTCWRRCGPRRS